MKAALLSLLLASTALAQELPRMYQAEKPETVGYPNWVLTDNGKKDLDAAIAAKWAEVEALKTANTKLQLDVMNLAAKPELTWKGALLLIGGGLVLGVTVGVVLGKRL